MTRLFTLLMTVTLLSASGYLLAQNPFPGYGKEFRQDEVPRVDILIDEADLATILDPDNVWSNEEYPATFIFTDATNVDTMLDVGFRLRGNTSRTAGKKSFRVSFNTFVDEKWEGLEKLNLNGEHNDPSVSRSRVCWQLLREMGVPGARANHVALYVNGDYRGLYANVEQIDEEFVDQRFGNNDGNLYKCLWPANLQYISDNPDDYKFLTNTRRAYDLETNEEEDDYSDLANFIDVINNTSVGDLPCALEPIFNVDGYLRVMAFDVLTGNWDGYLNQNNFYLYNNTATGKFEYIPYDLDNTLGIDWFGVDWANRDPYAWMNEPRPLFDQMLAVEEYRDRFTYYLETFADEFLSPVALYSELDALRDLIAPYITDDDFYPLDYGFSTQDFTNSWSSGTPYDHTDYSLKGYFLARRTAALEQAENSDPAPYVFAPVAQPAGVGQELAFRVNVQEESSSLEARLRYRINGGSEQNATMWDDGAHGDGAANDGIYGTFLPALSEAATIAYYFTAQDNNGQTTRLPACGEYSFSVQAGGLSLAVNELMASNDITIADEFDEFDDWVELHNYGATSISLDGLYLSDNPDNPTKWAFPDVSLEAGGYLLIWADNDEEQGPLHTDFKLAAEGEYIGIFASDTNNNDLIDGVEFGALAADEAFGRIPNGTGAFQTVSPTPAASNLPVSTREPIALIPFEVYPNPAQQWLRLNTEAAAEYTAQLFDVSGRVVQTHNWNGSTTEWPLRVPSGIYALKVVRDGAVVFVEKVVVD